MTNCKENQNTLQAVDNSMSATMESEHDLWLDTLANVGLLCDQPQLANSISCPRPKAIDGHLCLTVDESVQLRLAVNALAEQAAERCRQLTRLLADLELHRDRSAALDRALKILGLRRPVELDGALSDLLSISDAYAAALPVLDAAKAVVFDDYADNLIADNLGQAGQVGSGDVQSHRHSNAELLAELEQRRRQHRRHQHHRRDQHRSRRRCNSEGGRGKQRASVGSEFEESQLRDKNIGSSLVMTPTEADQFVQHFARLFDTPTALPACEARLSLLHRRVNECDSLMNNLRDTLRLPSNTSSRAVAAAVERLATTRESEARDCLARLLGPDEISGLASRLAEYDRFFGQFTGLVSELREELGVSRMSHILPAVCACARVARAAGWDGGGTGGSLRSRT
uniref:Centrosomal protein of 70 kDa n=1 Tax=Macrostomum lignano TaxID=282301 RepID=A0A1I8HWW3_9PLAT